MNTFDKEILKNCTIKAIEHLDKNHWDSKNNSRTGDLIFNEKLYPTKPILWNINEQIERNNLNVKVPSSVTPGEKAFLFFEDLGFEIKRKKMFGFEILIDRYIKILQTKGEPDEKYKYDSINVFLENWDIDAADFYKMFLNSLAKKSNLLFQNSWGFINLCAKHLPEKARELFINLYDESISLEDRIVNFQNESKNLVDDVKKLSYKQTLNHQQDERTIALYLAFRYPEKYILYKNDFYKSYCDEFEIKIEKVGKKFLHLNQIVDDIIKSEVIYEEELQKIYRNYYPKPSWNDDRLMIQNILYVCYKEEKKSDDIIEILNRFDYDNLLKYYKFLDEIIEINDLAEEDDRLVFNYSINEKEINLTIGKRLSWSLSKNRFRVISNKIFSGHTEKFEKPSNAYLNYSSDYNLIQSQTENIFDAIKTELKNSSNSAYKKHNKEIIEKLAFDIDFRELIFSQLDKNTSPNIDLTQITINKMNNFPLNQILYGAPGTGKTYTTKKLAIEIIDGKEYLDSTEEERDVILKRYNELASANQIQFTTFHQSMSYEDFIEGIKPKLDNDDEVNYEIRDGIFKSISKIASNQVLTNFDSKSELQTFEIAWNNLIDLVKNKLSEDKLMKIGSWEYGLSSNESLKYESLNSPSKYTFTITKKNIFDTYQNKLARPSGAFQKDMKIILNFMKTQFNLIDFEEIEVNLKKQPIQKYVLIIDEINRGNVSSIFGELITLLEEDKRKGNKEEIEVVLPYSQDKFSVPNNLYIIGTMNTADRSVESLDTALRRRFSFIEMLSKPEKLVNVTIEDAEEIDLEQLLDKINQRIELLIDKDHQIGHSFFISLKDLNGLRTAFKNKIIPLLEEYFFGDFGKIGLVLGDNFISVKNENNNSGILAKFSAYEEVDFITEKKVYQIKNCDELKAQDFISIYE